MVYIIQDEIPDYANIFIDDLAIKGPKSDYADENGVQEVLTENPGIRRYQAEVRFFIIFACFRIET